MADDTSNTTTPQTADTAADTAAVTAAETAPETTAGVKERGRLQTKTGTVVSNKMDKTAVVVVTNTVMHPLYRRYMKRTTKFHAHDETNQCGIGDEVLITSSRPLSRTKRWRVREILKRAE